MSMCVEKCVVGLMGICIMRRCLCIMFNDLWNIIIQLGDIHNFTSYPTERIGSITFTDCQLSNRNHNLRGKKVRVFDTGQGTTSM